MSICHGVHWSRNQLNSWITGASQPNRQLHRSAMSPQTFREALGRQPDVLGLSFMRLGLAIRSSPCKRTGMMNGRLRELGVEGCDEAPTGSMTECYRTSGSVPDARRTRNSDDDRFFAERFQRSIISSLDFGGCRGELPIGRDAPRREPARAGGVVPCTHSRSPASREPGAG
jgi:hypothetical protein